MYRTILFHLGRLICFSMAAPSTTIYSNYKNNNIPRLAYIPLAIKLSTLAYACSSWTKASLILQQQNQIVTTNNVLSENEKKIVSGLHISVTYLLLRLFHQKGYNPANARGSGGRISKLKIFSSKLIIPLIIGLIICTIIEESGLVLLLQLTCGSRRVYAISGRNSIKVDKYREYDDIPSGEKAISKINSQEDINLNASQTPLIQVANVNNSVQQNDISSETPKSDENKDNNFKNNGNDINNNKNNKSEVVNNNEDNKETKIDNNKSVDSSKTYYHDDCCICLGACNYPVMESFCVVESHVAHTQCMLNWLQASKLKQQCPLCRQPLQVFIMSESMHDYVYGYPTLSQFIQRNLDWKCFLKRAGITLSVTASLLVILQMKIIINNCKYHNLQYSSSS